MSQIQATPIPRNNTPRLLRYRPLLLLLLIAFPGCKIFEYPPEQITLDDNAIHVANIGFKGYRLHLPPGFRRLSDNEVDQLPAHHWIIRLRRGYRNSEGIDYHFFSDHVFQKDKQLIYYVPFLNKRVQKFIYVPEDILERYLINWVRHAEFTKRIQLDLDNLNAGNRYELTAGSTTVGIAQAALQLGTGVNHSTTSGQYGFKISTSDRQTNLAGAIANNHYIEFSISAQTGYILNLESLSFKGQSATTGADNVALLSSIGGFSNSAVMGSLSGIAGTSGGFDTDASGFGGLIDLSSADYQNITSVRFRLYGWNTSGSTGATYFRNLSGNDLVVSGTVNVPEINSVALLVGTFTLLVVLAQRSYQRRSLIPYRKIDK